MLKKLTALFLFLFFALSPGALAASPDDALTGRPNSVRLKLRLDNLENVKDIFAHPLVALYSTFFGEEKAGGVLYALNLALGLRPKSIVFIVGTDLEQPFLQMAVSMPEAALPRLNSIERGKATKTELIKFLMGEADREPEKDLSPVVSEGANGPYYFFKETVFLAARGNLIVIALSLEDLNASLNALDKAGIGRVAFNGGTLFDKDVIL